MAHWHCTEMEWISPTLAMSCLSDWQGREQWGDGQELGCNAIPRSSLPTAHTTYQGDDYYRVRYPVYTRGSHEVQRCQQLCECLTLFRDSAHSAS